LRRPRKKRRNKIEEDSDMENEEKRTSSKQALDKAIRRHRINIPRRGSGGGHMPQVFIHHNFRYGPEPPAYKTPRPQYPSYTRREQERPPAHDRHTVIEKSVDDKMFELLIREIWKELAEDGDTFLEDLESKDKADEIPDLTLKELEKATDSLEKHLSKTELEPIMEHIQRKRDELIEAQYDPEKLLKELETYPTEELLDKTLAQLNSEPKFREEEVEGCQVETAELIPSEPVNVELPMKHNTRPTEVGSPEVMPEFVPEIEAQLSEEMLSDIEDLLHEVEPEIEEEEVEPSY